MKKKSMVALLTAVALSATVFAGCDKTVNLGGRGKDQGTEAGGVTEIETQSTETETGTGSIDAAAIDAELAALEEQAKEMNEELQSGLLAQQEMNRLSGELYRLWDDELNSLWSRLKETLEEDEMEQLTQEQKEWVSRKEEEVKEAGKEAEGGTLQPLLENDEAAVLTRERVYELAEILKGE